MWVGPEANRLGLVILDVDTGEDKVLVHILHGKNQPG